MSSISDLSESIGAVARDVGPSAVGLGRGWGLGSGVVVAEGKVLTSAHNLRREEVGVNFTDGRREAGEALGIDTDLDLAVIEADTGAAPAVAWEPAEDPPALGSPVFALANPGGRGLRVTLGFVSSEGRSFRGPRGRRIQGAIEHTAPLPRGSSGGPLVSAEGKLLGINSLRMEGGLILAVPATPAVHERVTLLGRGEAVAPHRLGVAIAPPRVARRMRRAVGLSDRPGLLVRAVEGGSPADTAGLERGDLLVGALGRELDGVDGLYSALDRVPAAGGDLELRVVRGEEERELTVSFGAERSAA